MVADMYKGVGDFMRGEHHTKEVTPHCPCLLSLGPGWWGSAVKFNNTGAVAVINSGYSRVPQIMHVLRCLFFILAYFQISVHAVHMPGQHNRIPDAISRILI